MFRITLALLLGSVTLVAAAADQPKLSPNEEALAIYKQYEAGAKSLEIEAARWWYDANASGKPEDGEKQHQARLALMAYNNNPQRFARIKALRDGKQVTDPVAVRLLQCLFENHICAAGDPNTRAEIVALEMEVQRLFNQHVVRVGDKDCNQNEVREILAKTDDPKKAEAAWKGFFDVGQKTGDPLRRLAKLRNEVARGLGYRDFHAQCLDAQELDEAAFLKLFEELDQLTAEPFAALKKELDQRRAAHFKIDVKDLRPWHFGDLYFQEAPPSDKLDLDKFYKDVDLVEMSRKYYAGIGLPVDDILARSDLFEKPGKCPGAFCCPVDRYTDIRILCNVKNNVAWADTMLHELGHALYAKNTGPQVPFFLRGSSHAMTTEGIAMMFGAMAKNEAFLREVAGADPAEAAAAAAEVQKLLRTQRLMFARFTLMMVHFERGLYADPDQDLDKLWNDLRQRYQLFTPPGEAGRADFAVKSHILTAPVYYHNYLLGELFASQVRHYIEREVLKLPEASPGQPGPTTCFAGKPEVGAYIREKIYSPAGLSKWDKLTRDATGEDLTAKYYAEDVK